MTTLREKLMKAADEALPEFITDLIDCVVEQRETLQAICDEKELRTYFACETALKATDEKLKPWLEKKL